MADLYASPYVIGWKFPCSSMYKKQLAPKRTNTAMTPTENLSLPDIRVSFQINNYDSSLSIDICHRIYLILNLAISGETVEKAQMLRF
jgi:hypothetical protein